MSDLEAAWSSVHDEASRLKPIHLRDLFGQDPSRFDGLSVRLDDLLIDFSKEKLDQQALAALLTLARETQVEAKRDAMFAGDPVNTTENRPALHMALRGGAGAHVPVGGVDIMPEVNATRDRFLAFAEDVRSGTVASASGAQFTDVVGIGIGGSSLGPEMATRALTPWHDGPRLHFVSNVDGAHLADTLRDLDPARTLVIVASKTFTTQETMTNASSARSWLAGALGADAGRHMAAASTNLEATRAFGIDDSRVFGFWDWVGGRYSVWSSIGLPLAIAVGAGNFRAMLAGACGMDEHFRTAPMEQNLPALLGLIGVWRRNAMGCPATAVIPYDQRLARFPAYLQQLEMESNGKRVTRDGEPVSMATGTLIWGEPGTNAQHSFFQLLHQGTDIIPVDFLLGAEPQRGLSGHHAQLAANAFAQSAALAFGRAGEQPAHRAFPGDRPSTMILYRRLDPETLGRLIALQEHKVFVQAAVWDINPFDQWGVELGKSLAEDLLPSVEGAALPQGGDSSTEALIAHFKALRSTGDT
jgi:glucose-6-phosphate isomerase